VAAVAAARQGLAGDHVADDLDSGGREQWAALCRRWKCGGRIDVVSGHEDAF
jgi:hypothetical protein